MASHVFPPIAPTTTHDATGLAPTGSCGATQPCSGVTILLSAAFGAGTSGTSPRFVHLVKQAA